MPSALYNRSLSSSMFSAEGSVGRMVQTGADSQSHRCFSATRSWLACQSVASCGNRMKYAEDLRPGYPIASSAIEGACRHLVKDRMEQTGMRWTLEGARSMLHVRAAFQSDHWEAFLADRMSGETQRTHPHRDLLNAYQPTAPAC